MPKEPSLITSSARSWLKTFTASHIPRNEFQITFSRATGPGGQHVNKVSSKATVKMSKQAWGSIGWVPPELRPQLYNGKFPYVTKSGSLMIQADRHRSSFQNEDECFEKLAQAIKQHIYIEPEVDPQDADKWNRLAKVAKERKMLDKKFRSGKKESRRGGFE